MTLPPAPPPPPPSAAATSESKGRNCWVVGCGGCCVTLLVLLVLIWLGFAWMKTTFMVEPFDPVSLSDPEAVQAEAKLQSLQLLDESGQPAASIELPGQGILLTEKEMNYWLSQQDPALADSVRLDFEPDEVTAEFRVGEEGSPQRWRLLARLSVRQTEYGLDVRMLDLKLGNFSLPTSVMDELGTENLAAEVFADPETLQEFQDKVEKIEILKDQILFVPKAP